MIIFRDVLGFSFGEPHNTDRMNAPVEDTRDEVPGFGAGDQPPAFGPLLRQFREGSRMTQGELAAAAHLSIPTISALERGIRGMPYMETARLLADALGLDAEDRARFEASFRQQRRPRRRPSPAGSPAAIPVPREPMLGRDLEVAAIEARLADASLTGVTLTGPGGVGKTRIAQAIASRRADRGGDVVWVSLASERDPGAVLTVIAGAAGIPSAGDGPLLDRLAARLSGKRSLLVLDNMERLIPAGPDLAELRVAVPDLSLLATSRVRLRMGGEAVVVVPPLPLPPKTAADAESTLTNPAVALFRRGLTDPGSAPIVDCVRVVRLLDGLPLAIELASAQCHTLPPATIADLLEQAGHGVLAPGPAAAPDRLRTMDAAIAWSADLLPDPARRLFPLLSCFRGGFTVEAVSALACGLRSPDLVNGVSLLAEAHLVQPAPEGSSGASRLMMLEPIRQFAQARLRESGEEPRAREAHARWFIARAARLGAATAGSNPIPALDALADDLANLQAALEYVAEAGVADLALLDAGTAAAAINWRFWEYRSALSNGRSLLERLLAVAADAGLAPSLAQADACFTAGYASVLMMDAGSTSRHWRRLRAMADALDSSEHRSLALQLEAGILMDQPGRAGDAIALLYEAREVGREQQGFALWAATLLLGVQVVQQGDPAGGIHLLEEAAAAARVEGRALDLPVVLAQSGLASIEAGDFDAARERLREAARLADRFDLPSIAVLSALGLARTATQSGHSAAFPDAARLLGVADAVIGRTGYGYGEWWERAVSECRGVLEADLGRRRVAALIAAGHRLELTAIVG